MPQLIVFDLGGVLVKVRGTREVLCEAARLQPLLAAPSPDVLGALAELERQATVGAIDSGPLLAQIAELLGITVRQARQVFDSILVGMYPGIPQLLEELSHSGETMACLSNTNAHHWHMLMDDGVPEYRCLGLMRYRFASHLIGCRKPDPAIFQYVESTTGVTGSDIIYFDDTPEHCAAAAALGWRSHCIDPSGDPARQILEKQRCFQIPRRPRPKGR
ncbi:MAG TPA: HAD-IA family hydrolase [Phycisphaerae bacterium]|nr:HAD-IA family hydrolase [Phycisphaerae bacterium]